MKISNTNTLNTKKMNISPPFPHQHKLANDTDFFLYLSGWAETLKKVNKPNLRESQIYLTCMPLPLPYLHFLSKGALRLF